MAAVHNNMHMMPHHMILWNLQKDSAIYESFRDMYGDIPLISHKR